MPDPVVTASGDRLRFESFSACNGVYARLDLLADGIDSGEIAFGTTNVDLNQPLRSALAGLGANALVHLGVGSDSLRVSTLDESHEERKVEMPDRWIRGFAEVPVIAARMEQRAELPAAAIGSFVARLPKGAPGPSYYVVPSPVGLRQSARQVPGAVHLAGTARLSAAARGQAWRINSHWVQETPTGLTCTCPWYAKHQSHRGPCKHVLAVLLTIQPPLPHPADRDCSND